MKALNTFLLAGVLLLLTLSVQGQYRYRYLRVGISAGPSNYLGDLDDDAPYKFTRPGFGIQGTYRLNPVLSTRLSFNNTWIAGSDRSSLDPSRRRRNLEFRSMIQEFSGQLVVDFIPTTRRYPFRPVFVPYMFGGLAIFNFNPQAKYDGRWWDLHPLGTEGQYLDDPNAPDPYKLSQVSIPMGFGLRFSVGKRWDMEIESGLRKTFTDYLDDVSHLYPDLGAWSARHGGPELARRFVDPSSPQEFPTGVAWFNGIRGDNTQDDWYIYTCVSFNYIIDWVKCPAFR